MISKVSSSRLVRYAAIPLRHSLAGRILAGFIVMTFLSMAAALIGISYTNEANARLIELLRQDKQVTADILKMERAAERQNSSMRAYLLTGDPKVNQEIANALTDYADANDDLGRMLINVKIPNDQYEMVKDTYSDYSDLVSFIRSLKLSDFNRAPTFLWENNGTRSGPAIKEQLILEIDGLLNLYQINIDGQVEAARQQIFNATVLAPALVTAAGLLVALVMLLVIRSITRPLRILASVARSIRQGNLEVNVPTIRGEDEVANLAGAMRSMAENLRISRQELEASLQATKLRNRDLAALNRVADTIGQSLDLNEVLHEALGQLITVAQAQHGSIFLLEPDNETLRLVAFENQSEDYIRSYNRVKVGEQITGTVAKTGEVMMVANPMDDPRVVNPVLKSEANVKRFYLGVPFKSKGKVLGVANLTSSVIRELEPRELELLSAIGNQIGVAVDNARLYQQAAQVAALDERNRLARDLHDSVTQTLFSITLTAESIKAMLSRKPERVEGQVDRLQNLARGALAEMRSLIFQLRPAALQEQGLVAALEKHIAALRAKETFEIELKILGGDRRLSDENEQTLYRVAQEAFNNIIKHSQATRVAVTLEIEDEAVRLQVRDNGKGFDAAAVMAQRDRSSLGLTSMKERTELAGGTYTIESTPGNGTSLTVYIPLSEVPHPVGVGIVTSPEAS